MTQKKTRKAKVNVTKFDAAEYLDSPKMIAAYLNEVFATGDEKLIAAALNDVARAKGVSGIAKAAGINRTSLYLSFSGKRKPEFSTVQKVLDAMDMTLAVKPKEAA